MTNDYSIRNIELIQLYGGPKLRTKGFIYIFSDNNTYFDYALIEVEEDEELFSRAAIISEDPGYLSQTIRGISYRDLNIVYIEGQIVEIDQNHTHIYQIICGGLMIFPLQNIFMKMVNLKQFIEVEANFL